MRLKENIYFEDYCNETKIFISRDNDVSILF